MDEQGRKMSKSLWNAMAPAEITNKFGADVLRLWACMVDYQADCSVGDNILKQVSDTYRKVRNTFRFLVGNPTAIRLARTICSMLKRFRRRTSSSSLCSTIRLMKSARRTTNTVSQMRST